MAATHTGPRAGPDAGTGAAVLDGALDWLTAHAEWFGPRWDDHFPPREFDGATVMELLMLCRLLRRSGPSRAARRLERAAVGVAAGTVRGPGTGGPGTREPGPRSGTDHLAYRLWVLALLAELDSPDDTAFAGERALAERYPPRGDRTGASPVHALELRHILDLAGIPAPADLPGTAALYDACVAEHGDRADEYDAYGITHTVLYATDFGARPLPGDAAHMGRVLDGLLRVFLERGHLDLVAELLLCARITGDTSPETVRSAWDRLAGAQRPDGSLPGPPFDPAVLAGRTGERATAYAFRTCYHTTLVTAMAAAHTGTPPRP